MNLKAGSLRYSKRQVRVFKVICPECIIEQQTLFKRFKCRNCGKYFEIKDNLCYA